MDSRFGFRSISQNLTSENATPHLSAKSTLTLENTPRKLPFSDKTNKAGENLLRSAVKEKLTVVPEVESKISEGDFDFDDFVPPKDKNCFCCGPERISDEEIFGYSKVLDEDFHLRLLSHFDSLNIEDDEIPDSPFLEPERIQIDWSYKFDEEIPEFSDSIECNMTDDMKLEFKYAEKKLNETCDFDEESDLEVPDFDFSFDVGSAGNTTAAHDVSVLGDW